MTTTAPAPGAPDDLFGEEQHETPTNEPDPNLPEPGDDELDEVADGKEIDYGFLAELRVDPTDLIGTTRIIMHFDWPIESMPEPETLSVAFASLTAEERILTCLTVGLGVDPQDDYTISRALRTKKAQVAAKIAAVKKKIEKALVVVGRLRAQRIAPKNGADGSATTVQPGPSAKIE